MSSLGFVGGFVQQYEDWKAKTTLSSIKVSVRRLDTLLHTCEPKVERIDVLAVDVEGWELNVMRGLSIERYRPGIAIIENLFEDPAYDDYILPYGYERWRRLQFNDIYVRHGFGVGS
jgi:hypothetical protein